MQLKSTLVLLILTLGLSSCHLIDIEPEDAWGPLRSNYEPKGFNQTLGDDLLVYIAGLPGTTDKAVVWGHDSYGPGSGTTYELVDRLAEDTGFLVLLPDFFRGEVLPPFRKYTWTDPIQVRRYCSIGIYFSTATLRKRTLYDICKGRFIYCFIVATQSDFENTLLPFMSAIGINSVGTVGTCWGGYFIVHAGAYPEVKAGFGAHPAHHSLITVTGDVLTEEEQYLDINDAGGAQYYFPTITENDSVRPGGLADQTLDTVMILWYCTNIRS